MPVVLKVVTLGKDEYSVVDGASAKGTVLYRKLGTDDKGYEVGFNDQGQLACTCRGYTYHGKCKHSTNFEEIAAELPETVTTKPVIEIPEGRVAFSDVEIAVDSVLEYIRNQDVKVEVAGSFRRGRAHVKDLDFVIVASPEDVHALCGEGTELTVAGRQVIRFDFCYDGDGGKIQADFCITTEEEWGAALMYLTGSKEFNIFMRKRAKTQGLSLSRHGLVERETDPVVVVASKTEREIFQVLGMDFVPPSSRDEKNWMEYLKD